MDSLEQWIFDIGRHVGALEAENEVLNETVEELETGDNTPQIDVRALKPSTGWQAWAWSYDVAENRLEQLQTLIDEQSDLRAQIEALTAALEGTETCHLDALGQIEELENELDNMTRSRDWFRRQYDELLRKPVPHDPLVQAAEGALHSRMLTLGVFDSDDWG